MGYESKIYIAERGSSKDDDGRTYARVIAMFNMCKIGSIVNVFKSKTDCYFYADDGDTKVLEDQNGEALTEATIEDVVCALEEAVKNGEEYRRIFPLLSTLKTIHEQQMSGEWGEIVIIHYGY